MIHGYIHAPSIFSSSFVPLSLPSCLVVDACAFLTLILKLFSGDYSVDSLVEMIALHVEATFPESETWREFASCFLKLYEYEEDRLSVCLDGNECEQKANSSIYYKRMPSIFTEVNSRRAWRLRCRCWLKRHFGKRMLASEIASGAFLFPII